MNIVEVPIRDLLEAPQAHRIRGIDESRIRALADSLKAGSPIRNPLIAYKANGKWHVVGGIHRLRALRLAFGEDSGICVPVWPVDPKKDREARYEAAKDNNTLPMTMLEWQGIFAEAKADFPTHAAMARNFGVTPAFVSECLNYDSYAEAREARNVKSLNTRNVHSVGPAPQGGEPVPSSVSTPSHLHPPNDAMTPVPSQGERPADPPETPPETGDEGGVVGRLAALKPALSGSKGPDGSMDRGDQGSHPAMLAPSPSAPLSSPPERPLLRRWDDAETALRALLTRKALREAPEADLRAIAIRSESLALDAQTAVQRALARQDVPARVEVPKPVRGTVVRFLLNGREHELPLLEAKASGYRVGKGRVEFFVSKKDIVSVTEMRA